MLTLFLLDTVAIRMDEREEGEDLGQRISFKIKKCGGKHMYYSTDISLQIVTCSYQGD